MANVTHQTVKLSSGRHASPQDGVCVMELASMLAGESFSDHPVSACPLIGGFLTAYNDSLDDDRRQDLYHYASRVVGSRASQDVQDARVDRVTSLALELTGPRWTRFVVARRLRALACRREPGPLGYHAARAIVASGALTHADVLAFIDELLAYTGSPALAAADLQPSSSGDRASEDGAELRV